MGGGGGSSRKCWSLLLTNVSAPKRAVVVVVVFSVHETRSLAAGILGHGLRTLADGVFCKFTGKQKSYRCLDLS